MDLLLDVMCGGIAAHLRMCGHDTVYALDRDIEADDVLLELARREKRTLVTRDRQLADRAPESIQLEATSTEEQLAELAAAGLPLELQERPTYCGVCNGRLVAVGPDEPTPEYAPSPAADECWHCVDCGQYFWRGSHWEDVARQLPD
jgi:hypothetical protein